MRIVPLVLSSSDFVVFICTASLCPRQPPRGHESARSPSGFPSVQGAVRVWSQSAGPRGPPQKAAPRRREAATLGRAHAPLPHLTYLRF